MRRVIIIFTIIFSSLLWWGVYSAGQNSQVVTINFFQDLQRDVLRVAQSSFTNWLDEQLAINPDLDLNNLGQDYYRQFSSPISPTTYGDIFVFQDGVPIFDNYHLFIDKYPGQSIKEFIEIQAERVGAEHYYQMVDEIMKGHEGKGWWIWDAERRGQEVAVWQPVGYKDKLFVLMMTTPQQLIYDVASVSQNKLYYSFIASIANILLILVFIFFYYWQEKKIKDALAESGTVSQVKELGHSLETCELNLKHHKDEVKKVNEELESAMNLMIDKDYKINDLQNKLKDKLG